MFDANNKFLMAILASFILMIGLMGCKVGSSSLPTGQLTLLATESIAINSMSSITVAPDGKFAYVVNSGNGYQAASILMYVIKPDGMLSFESITAIPGSSNSFDMTITPNGKFAYLVNQTLNTISMYSIQSNGYLSPLSPESIATLDLPASIMITPNGKFLYVTGISNGTMMVYSIEPNGSLNLVSQQVISTQTAYPPMFNMTATPNGKFAYILNSNYMENPGYNSLPTDLSFIAMYSIESTGMLTTLSSGVISAGLGSLDMVVTPNGKFEYVVNSNNIYNSGGYSPQISGNGTISMYSIGSNGALSSLSTESIAAGINSNFISLAPNGNFAYVVNTGSSTIPGSISMYSIGANGILSRLSPADIATGISPSRMAITPNGKFAYVVNTTDKTISIYSIN